MALYHNAFDASAATWMLLAAIAAFYLTAMLQRPGLLQMVTAQMVLASVPIAIAMGRPKWTHLFGLRAPHHRALLGAVLVGATAWYPNLRLALWVQSLRDAPARVEGLERLLDAPQVGWTIACLAVFPAVCEELAFRGLWARALAQRFGIATAIVITAPVFGAYHLASAQLLPATVLGSVLAWACLRAGSLWISIAIHAVNNATAILASRGALGGIVSTMDAKPTAALIGALAIACAGLLMIATTPARRDCGASSA